jgi:hypothetical protein
LAVSSVYKNGTNEGINDGMLASQFKADMMAKLDAYQEKMVPG